MMNNHTKIIYCLDTGEAYYLDLLPSGRTFCLLPLILRVRLMKILFVKVPCV